MSQPWRVEAKHWSGDQRAAFLQSFLKDDLQSLGDIRDDIMIGTLLYGQPGDVRGWLAALFITKALRYCS